MAKDDLEKSPQEIRREVRKEFRLNLLIMIVCGIVGLIGVLAPMIVGGLSEPIERAVYSTIVGASLGALLVLTYRLTLFHAESLRLMNVISRFRDDLASAASWAQKKSLLENMSDRIIGQAACELLKDYEEVFDVSKASLTLRDRKWSLHFNRIFWRSMVEEGERKGMVVLVTHTSGVENWMGTEAQESLEEQRDFIQEGNQIVRMFVDRSVAKVDTIPEPYSALMRLMEEEYGIKTLYVPAKPLRQIPDGTWVLGMDIFMTWSGSSGEHFQVGSQHTELKDFKELWPKHYARAIPLPGSAIAMPAHIETYLAKKRTARKKATPPPAAAPPGRGPRR